MNSGNMPTDPAEECPHLGRPLTHPTECTICSGKDALLRQNDEYMEQNTWNPVTAKYSGWCRQCNDRILPGNTIYVTRSGLGPLCEPCGMQ